MGPGHFIVLSCGITPGWPQRCGSPGRGVTGGAAKERGTTPSQPKKADVTHHRDSCEGQTPAGDHDSNESTDLVLPLGDHARKGTTKEESKLRSSMDVSEKKTTAGRGQDRGTRRPLPDKPAEGASAEINAATKRPKIAPGFWTFRPRNAHLWN